MEIDNEIAKRTIGLLSSTDLDKVSKLSAELIQQITRSQFVGLLMWDPDLESVADHFLFEKKGKEIEQFISGLSEHLEPDGEELEEIDAESLASDIPEQLSPLMCYRVASGNRLCCFILFQYAEPTE